MISGSTIRILALSALLAALPAAVAGTSAEWTVPRLMAALRDSGPRETGFVEEKRVGLLEQTLVVKGRLRYLSPGELERIVVEPEPERYSVRGDLLTIESGKRPPRRLRLSEQPVLEAFIGSLRDTLAGDRQALERHYRLDLLGGREAWQLTLTPLAGPLRQYLQEVRIRGNGGEIQAFELLESNGDSSLTRLIPDHD